MGRSLPALIPWFVAGLPIGALLLALGHTVGMSFRAKRAEVPSNLASLREAIVGYRDAFDEVPSCGDDGAGRLGKAARPWKEEPDLACFQELGWAPDGDIRGSYQVIASPDAQDFLLLGFIDIDDDGDVAVYSATAEQGPVSVTHPRRTW